MSLGERLKMARERKGLSQIEVSKLSKIKNVTISNYEINYRKPTPDKLATLAKLYGVSADYLLGLTNDITVTPKQFETKKEALLSANEAKLLTTFSNLNEAGQAKVIDYTKDLDDSKKYMPERASTKDNTLPGEAG